MKTKESKLTKKTLENLERIFDQTPRDEDFVRRFNLSPFQGVAGHPGAVIYFCVGGGHGARHADLGLTVITERGYCMQTAASIVRPGESNLDRFKLSEEWEHRRIEAQILIEAWIREHRPDVRILTEAELKAQRAWEQRMKHLEQAEAHLRTLEDFPEALEAVREGLRKHLDACPLAVVRKRFEAQLEAQLSRARLNAEPDDLERLREKDPS